MSEDWATKPINAFIDTFISLNVFKFFFFEFVDFEKHRVSEKKRCHLEVSQIGHDESAIFRDNLRILLIRRSDV